MSHSVLPVSPPVPLSEPQAHAVLDAAVWQSLSGPEHARLSEGDDLVRRYREGVSPFVAVRDVSDPRTWDALLALVGPGAAVPLVVDPADVPESWEAGEAVVINSENLHRRLPVPPGGDELGRLAATLNTMLDDIAAVQRSQRRFVADASHELRSPRYARARRPHDADPKAPRSRSWPTGCWCRSCRWRSWCGPSSRWRGWRMPRC